MPPTRKENPVWLWSTETKSIEFDFESQFQAFSLLETSNLPKVPRGSNRPVTAALVDYGGQSPTAVLAFLGNFTADYYSDPGRLTVWHLNRRRKSYAASQKAEEEDDAETRNAS